jgi:hypothetical protein
MGLDELGFLEMVPPVEGAPCVFATGMAPVGVGPVTGTGAGAPPQACNTGSKTSRVARAFKRNRFITLSFLTN